MAEKFKIKKGDKVVVVTGRDRGRQGEVIEVLRAESRVRVQGVNMVKRHRRATQTDAGGIVSMEAPLHISNVAHIDPESGKATRVGYEEKENTFYLPSTMSVGDAFAGDLRLNSATGLSVQGRLSVGHESVDSTGATTYIKDNLLVGSTAHQLMPTDYKGILVSGRLAVGTSSLMGSISLNGGFKLKEKMSFYTDGKKKFEIKPRKISVIPGSYGMRFDVSNSMFIFLAIVPSL